MSYNLLPVVDDAVIAIGKRSDAPCVASALRGGRDRVVRALLAHPLIGQADLSERLADKLIAINTQYLPWARA